MLGAIQRQDQRAVQQLTRRAVGLLVSNSSWPRILRLGDSAANSAIDTSCPAPMLIAHRRKSSSAETRRRREIIDIEESRSGFRFPHTTTAPLRAWLVKAAQQRCRNMTVLGCNCHRPVQVVGIAEMKSSPYWSERLTHLDTGDFGHRIPLVVGSSGRQKLAFANRLLGKFGRCRRPEKQKPLGRDRVTGLDDVEFDRKIFAQKFHRQECCRNSAHPTGRIDDDVGRFISIHRRIGSSLERSTSLRATSYRAAFARQTPNDRRPDHAFMACDKTFFRKSRNEKASYQSPAHTG